MARPARSRQDSGRSSAGTESHQQQLEASRWRSSRAPCFTHQRSPGTVGKGGGKVSGGYQPNGGSQPGCLRSTPLRIVAAECKPTPARAPLNSRQARFAQRFLSRPRDQQGSERRDAALTTRLRGAATLHPGETTEEQRWGRSRSFPGRVLVEKRESALATARGWRKSRDTLWTDRSRLEKGRVRVAVVWWEGVGCDGRPYYLGKNKVYDAEVYAIYRALRITEQRETNRQYTIP